MDPSKRPSILEILQHPWMQMHKPHPNSQLPGSVYIALNYLETATNPALLLNSSPVTRMPVASGDSQESREDTDSLSFEELKPHPICSHSSATPSSSSSAVELEFLNSRPTCPVFNFDTDLESPLCDSTSVPKAEAISTPRQASQDQLLLQKGILDTHRCSPESARPPTTHSVSDDDDGGGSSSNENYQVFSVQPFETRIPQGSPIPIVPRLHSDGSDSSSGYYSRSESLSSNEGKQLVSAMMATNSRTCSTVSHTASLMSVSKVVTTTRGDNSPCITAVSPSHSQPRSVEFATHLHCWRSGSSSTTSSDSASSHSSSKSSYFDTHLPPSVSTNSSTGLHYSTSLTYLTANSNSLGLLPWSIFLASSKPTPGVFKDSAVHSHFPCSNHALPLSSAVVANSSTLDMEALSSLLSPSSSDLYTPMTVQEWFCNNNNTNNNNNAKMDQV